MGGSKDFKNSGTNIKATKITKVYCQKLLWIFIILKNYKNKIVRVANIAKGSKDSVRSRCSKGCISSEWRNGSEIIGCSKSSKDSEGREGSGPARVGWQALCCSWLLPLKGFLCVSLNRPITPSPLTTTEFRILQNELWNSLFQICDPILKLI